MGIKELVARIDENGVYQHEIEGIRVGFVDSFRESEKIFYQRLYWGLRAALMRRDDNQVMAVSSEAIPGEVNVGAWMTDDFFREVRPEDGWGKFPKPKNDKKVFYVGVFGEDVIPWKAESDVLSKVGREFLTRKAAHAGAAIEGEVKSSDFKEGARAIIWSMEGDVGKVVFEGDEGEFFGEIGERVQLLGGVEMVEKRVGEEYEGIDFKKWCDRKVVQEIAYASKRLGEKGFLWDLNLRKTWSGRRISRRQIWKIEYSLKQAGLGVGNLSGIDRESRVVATTETGVNKPRIDPLRGEVVAVFGMTENGARHWILNGFPRGHPFFILRHPLQSSWRDLTYFVSSMIKRGKVREFLKSIPHPFKTSWQGMKDYVAGEMKESRLREFYKLIPEVVRVMKGEFESWIDHRPSIETHENAAMYMASALWESGKIRTFEDYLRYLEKGFEEREILPIIPEGCGVGWDAMAHLHLTAGEKQRDPQVRVIEMEMSRFGFKHSPGCGSREAALYMVCQLISGYQKNDVPTSNEEIWVINIPGHGCCLLGRRGMKQLADAIAAGRIDFERKVKRSMDLYSGS